MDYCIAQGFEVKACFPWLYIPRDGMQAVSSLFSVLFVLLLSLLDSICSCSPLGSRETQRKMVLKNSIS